MTNGSAGDVALCRVLLRFPFTFPSCRIQETVTAVVPAENGENLRPRVTDANIQWQDCSAGPHLVVAAASADGKTLGTRIGEFAHGDAIRRPACGRTGVCCGATRVDHKAAQKIRNSIPANK